MNDIVGVFWGEMDYPDRIAYFDENNHVYKLVEQGFFEMGLDRDNYGTHDWNPLAEYISPGDNVLIKPNMVLDENNGEGGTECLYTHPSLLVPVIKYVVRALKGNGEIVVGDAPLQRCNFQRLISKSGYEEIIEHYRNQGVRISLVDFRNVKTKVEGSIRYLQETKGCSGRIVNVGSFSAFCDISGEQMDRFRVTGYSSEVVRQHHKKNTHEYMISEYVLNADAVINMPKPKTHRKAGITAALKNLVGINTNKEFLPHHTSLGSDENGDEYKGKSYWHNLASQVSDIGNMLNDLGEVQLAKETFVLSEKLFSKAIEESDTGYSEGSWYGNDTIWRTIQDLNNILFYADKDGAINRNIKRKEFIIADMIVSGEEEGPLEPTPKPTGAICMGENPIMVDRTISEIMGFDWKKIPSLWKISLINVDSNDERREVITNNPNRKVTKFEPSIGWISALGSNQNEFVKNFCENDAKPVYVFGAYAGGRRNAEYLMSYGIKVEAFLDNNVNKVTENFYKNIPVKLPGEAIIDKTVVVAVPQVHRENVMDQLKKLGFENVLFMR